MAVRFAESFDGISTTTGDSSTSDTRDYLESRLATRNWAGNVSPQTSTGRLGEYSLGCGRNTNSDANIYYFGVRSQPQTVIVGFWMWCPRFEDQTAFAILKFKHEASGSQHLVFTVYDGVHVRVTLSTTVFLGTVNNAFNQEAWNFVEVKVKVDESPDGTIEMRVNGDTVLDLSGIDTQVGSYSFIDTIELKGGFGTSETDDTQTKYDDLYICDTLGARNNDFLGPVKVESLFPTSAGDSAGWTPSAGSNWENVDEVTFDTATYNEAAASTTKDLFNCNDLVYLTNVMAVDVNGIVQVDSPQEKALKLKVKSSTTEGIGPPESVVETSKYTVVSGIWEGNPHTGFSQWTVSEINNLQIGYEVG